MIPVLFRSILFFLALAVAMVIGFNLGQDRERKRQHQTAK